ncbi:MAG: PAS domain-containing sensor histidine kinase [Candidatus Eremiobacteraeota bacterium]|nr:PAS domain-containing sensor histidine kinase [Candidatus Eremiobacteraeota bacterium]
MSVRLSQLLVAIVLALVAVALFRTVAAYQQTAVVNDLRMRGAAIADRETRRLGDRISAIEELAASTALGGTGFRPRTFEHAARVLMADDRAIKMVDFFDVHDTHLVHIVAGAPGAVGPQLKRKAKVSRTEVQAVEVAIFDAELSRATSVADVPPNTSADTPMSNGPVLSRSHFYLATPVDERGQVGTIVEYLDAEQLLLDDISPQTTQPFGLDDGRGRDLQAAVFAPPASAERLTFAIPFADRVMQLRLLVPPRRSVSPWLFVLGYFSLVLAIVLPMEVVGQINRRVQALNEELETRVAERTQELEESLRESRRLAVVVESVHEGVMVVDGDGIIRYANDALCTELCCDVDDLLDKHISEVKALALSEQQLADIRAAVSETGFVYREMERTCADGTGYVAGITFTRHGFQDPKTLIAVSRDVTDRRRLVDQLLEAKSRLERETRARADFIATASHELRTPVTTLRTLAALLLDKLGPAQPQAPENAKLLDILDHESRRLAHLVDDLLKIARIDAPDAGLAEAPVDLCELVKLEVDEIVQLGPTAPSVVFQPSSSTAMVRGDAEALRSIVHNLVGNARKFTKADGRVDVKVDKDGSNARLIVTDTGAGIAASDLPHIFERFYRAPLTAASAPGAGLGLAIVARLVELMHGTISVASEVGRGTTITVEFPLAQEAVSQEPAPLTAGNG